MATAQPEVLPIILSGTDNTGAAWSSFRKNIGEGKSAVDLLRKSLESLGSGNASGSLQNAGSAARLLANPYVALTALIVGAGIAANASHNDILKLADAAKEVGVSANSIAGLSEKLQAAGASSDAAIVGLKNLRTQLDLNQRDGGYLEKLFKLNGSSIYQASGELKSVNAIYQELAGFIANARNNTEALDIATQAFGSETAPAFKKAIEQGATSLAKLGDGKSLDPLIAQSLQVKKIWDDLFDKSKSEGWLASLNGGFAQLYNNASLSLARILGSAEADRILTERNRNGGVNSPAASFADRFAPFAERPAGEQEGPFRPTTTPSSRGVDALAKNEFDRAVNSIGKHVSVMEADAAAVGRTAGEHEALRVQAQLLDAAQRAGIEVTGKQKDAFDALAERAKKAADALAFAKLQNDLMFERDQFGRSAIEQTVFSKLRAADIDPNSAQGELLAQQIRINETIRETQDISKDALKGFISDLRNGVTEGQAFANMLDKIAQKLADKALDAAINSLTGRGISGLGSLFGIGGGGGTFSAQDSALNAQLFPGFGTGHSGATIGKNVTGYKYIHPSYFDRAPRFHSGGRLGPREVPFIGLEGEEVGFPEQMKAKYGSGKANLKVGVTVINNAGADVSVGEPKSDGNGGFNIDVLIDKVTAKNAAKPGSATSKVLASGGVRQPLAKR